MWSVCLSVGHTGKPCKTAELIETPFGVYTSVDPRNCVGNYGVQIPPPKEELSEATIRVNPLNKSHIAELSGSTAGGGLG